MTAPPVQASEAIPSASGAATARRTARRWGLLLVAGWLCQAALRAWLSSGQSLPLANPDETAYLITARVLAGGPAANLSGGTMYPAGYPLLITPVFWFTHDPATAYHAVLLVNALISALLMPLAYVAGRRLGLSRPAAYGTGMVTALLPAGFFYSEYALTDAIFPVLTLAWLLAVHSWMRHGVTWRGQGGTWRGGVAPPGVYVTAAGSAALAGYTDAVHSRGLIIVACYLGFCAIVFVRRLVPRDSVVAAMGGLGVIMLASWALNLHLMKVLYPSGARSLSGQAKQRLTSVHGAVNVLEMAAGQLWRFVLDGWGVAGIGLIAAIAVMLRFDGIPARWVPPGTRLIAALMVAVTIGIAVTAPAALPPDQPQAWASGRYLDGMVTAFFVVGVAVLMRADRRRILATAALVVPPMVVAGIAVDAYAGPGVPTDGFSAAFSFAEPAILTQNWWRANVGLATLITLALLGLWVLVAVYLPGSALRRRVTLLAGLAALSAVATTQMSITISKASTPLERPALMTGVEPPDQVAVSRGLTWTIAIPEAYQVWWTQLGRFSPWDQAPPPGATVAELPWSGTSAAASWHNPPAGWHVAQYSEAGGWVAWRHTPLRGYVVPLPWSGKHHGSGLMSFAVRVRAWRREPRRDGVVGGFGTRGVASLAADRASWPMAARAGRRGTAAAAAELGDRRGLARHPGTDDPQAGAAASDR